MAETWMESQPYVSPMRLSSVAIRSGTSPSLANSQAPRSPVRTSGVLIRSSP
jgi:hypothetical protein